MSIADRIQTLRKSKGISQEELVEKLELISQILMLNDEDKTTMYDLAGKKRNSVAPDLPDYIMEHDYVSAALRTARDLDASEADWLKFVEELRQRKG